MEKETLWSYNLLDAQKEKRIYHSYSFWLIVVLHYNFLFVGNFLRILQPRFSIPSVFENLNFKITCLFRFILNTLHFQIKIQKVYISHELCYNI